MTYENCVWSGVLYATAVIQKILGEPGAATRARSVPGQMKVLRTLPKYNAIYLACLPVSTNLVA